MSNWPIVSAQTVKGIAMETIKIHAEATDLTNDGCGWSANCCWVRSVEIEMLASASDAAIARRVKRELGIQGMRADGWSGATWSWRDGCIGAWAEVVID